MARTQNIKFQMKSALNQMAYYGHSKHDDQVRTYQDRQQLKAQGVPREEYMRIDHTADKVFSYGTMKTYQAEISRYADWLSENGYKKCTMEQARDQMQNYLNYQRDRGLSAYSVHTTCAALCKVFQTKMQDYDIPERRLADITRSRGDKQHDKYNEDRAGEALEANRTLGLRRSELQRLRASNFEDRGTEIEMNTVGKGGKHNTTVFRDPEEIEKIRDMLNGKEPTDYVFERDLFKNDADFHQTRAEAFQSRYNRIVEDMENRPEARAEYQQIIRDTFAAKGKELRENLDHPYYCRGSHRQHLIEQGLPYAFDRTAVMMVTFAAECWFRITLPNK